MSSAFGAKGELKLFEKENIRFEDFDQPMEDLVKSEEKEKVSVKTEAEDNFLKEILNAVESYKPVSKRKHVSKTNVAYEQVSG